MTSSIAEGRLRCAASLVAAPLALRPLLDETLSPTRPTHRGLFDPVAVQRSIAGNDSGAADAGYTLFSLMCIELWCRTYLDGRLTGHLTVAPTHRNRRGVHPSMPGTPARRRGGHRQVARREVG